MKLDPRVFVRSERHPAWSWAVLGGLLAAAIVQPMACNGDGNGKDPVAEAQEKVLAAVGPEVVRPTLDRALTEASSLTDAVAGWAEAQNSGGDAAAALVAAQDAWRATMDVWQEAEVLQIGPAGSSLTAKGGADLRDEVYSWPTVNRCRVDQETVYGTFRDAGFFDDNLVNVYGLDALETLLFSVPGENGCPTEVDINTDGSWAGLGVDGVQQARADYAVVVAGGVKDTIAALVDAWDPSGGDFGAALAAGSTPFDGSTSALQAVFDALFYLETETKDRKLGGPLGLQDCVGSVCTSEAETLLAGGSDRWIAANLRSFRTLFTGGDGPGIDELLASTDEQELADAMIAALDQADAAAAQLDTPIHLAGAEDPVDAEALYVAVKGVTDLLKGDIATVLVVEIPAEADGDND